MLKVCQHTASNLADLLSIDEDEVGHLVTLSSGGTCRPIVTGHPNI